MALQEEKYSAVVQTSLAAAAILQFDQTKKSVYFGWTSGYGNIGVSREPSPGNSAEFLPLGRDSTPKHYELDAPVAVKNRSSSSLDLWYYYENW